MSSEDKIEELVYRASLRKNFWVDIKKLRIKHSIPPDGYTNEPENTGWYVKRGGKFVEYILEHNIKTIEPVISFDDALISFLEKYELPITADYLIINYILNNNKLILDNRKSRALFEVENRNSDGDHLLGNEAQWKARGDNYVKLLIHSLASKEDAIEFIRNNWGDVKRQMGTKGKQKRIRRSDYKERDAFIYDLYNSAYEKLFTNLGDSRRDIVVARLATQAGYGDVTSETVRKVASEQKKFRRE